MSSSPKAPSATKVLFGFHAVGVRLKTAPQSIVEVVFEGTRRDARMRQFLERAKEAGVRLIEADALRIARHARSTTCSTSSRARARCRCCWCSMA
jgi:23S rRNA (guanosine2251-2'-O)-methyltransferase